MSKPTPFDGITCGCCGNQPAKHWTETDEALCPDCLEGFLEERHTRDVLDDFTIEDPMTHETLRQYIEKYPDLASRLCDVFHECQMADLRAAADSK